MISPMDKERKEKEKQRRGPGLQGLINGNTKHNQYGVEQITNKSPKINFYSLAGNLEGTFIFLKYLFIYLLFFLSWIPIAIVTVTSFFL